MKRLAKCFAIVAKLFTSDDCVLNAASDVTISLFVKENFVTGVHPKNPILIPMHSLCCFLRIAPVAFHDEKAQIACTNLQLAQVCVEDAYAHAVTPTTFSKTLINYQAIQSKFSMLAALIHPAHAFMESIVAIIQAPGGSAGNERSPDADLGDLIGLLKVQASRTLEQAVRES